MSKQKTGFSQIFTLILTVIGTVGTIGSCLIALIALVLQTGTNSSASLPPHQLETPVSERVTRVTSTVTPLVQKPTGFAKPTQINLPTPFPQPIGNVTLPANQIAIYMSPCTWPFRCGGSGSLQPKQMEIYQEKIALVAAISFKGIGENYLWTTGEIGPVILVVDTTRLPAIEPARIDLREGSDFIAETRIWFLGSLNPGILTKSTIALEAPWLKERQGKIK